MRLALLLVLLSSPAFASLGPSNPPPGVTSKAWSEMLGRAAWVRDSVKKFSPNAKVGCIEAVALDLLGAIEVGWSTDPKGRGVGTKRTVAKGQEDAFKRALKDNADKACKDDGDGSGGLQSSVRGLLEWADRQEEWTSSGYGRLKADMLHSIHGFMALGSIVPAAEGGVAAFPSISLPILNPELFMPREDQSL